MRPVTPAEGSPRPDILVLMTDEHGAQFSGTYGHPFVATPAMDRMAVEGVTFDAAYCNNPLCVPSRLSFMTGRYTHNCRGWDNASPLGQDAPTWPHLLRTQGYEVVLSGKMHLVGADHLHGFERQLARDLHSELHIPPGNWQDGVPEAAAPWAGVVGPYPGEATGPGRTPEIDADDAAVDAALQFVAERSGGAPELRAKRRPFALCVGLIAPHYPFRVPEPFFSQYWPAEADLPHLPQGHLESLPPASRRLRRAFGFWGHSDEQVSRARAAYYGLVSYADDKLLQLLAALDTNGLAGSTVVVHTSDHGEMLGEHGLWRKMSFYEQSVRVPMQIRWPGCSTAGRRVTECVSLVDLTATLAEVAGVDAERRQSVGLDGCSVTSLLSGGDATWEDAAFCELTSHGTDRPRAMLRRGSWKLCLSGGDPLESELYDLAADAGEFHNLSGSAEVRDVERGLERELLERWDWRAIDEQVRQSQRERRTILEAAANQGVSPPF